MATHRILGQVIDSATTEPIGGLQVEAWDKDLIIDDLVGTTITDEQGNFVIEFDETYFQELFADRQPDLFFKILNEGEVIKSTENSVLWNVDRGAIKIPITVDSPDSLLNRSNVQFTKLDRKQIFNLRPDLIDWILLRPCQVRILMVTDGNLSFGSGDFGLQELVRIMSEESPGPWVRFQITKAHRGFDPDVNSDKRFFKFDTHNLFQYDQIWLIGFDISRPPYSNRLGNAELKALAQFMDNGGGVFATGDHEDLGAAMCGWVPRVRSMRKWFYPEPGPLGEPIAPVGSFGQPNLQNRHDTNREGRDRGYQFDDQSDDIPQTIEPTYYSRRVSALRQATYPHPLLCGPRGPIKVLPDHPHEGECYVPTDLTQTFTFDDYTLVEYPPLPDGTRLKPEVIATATVIGGHSTDNKPPVKSRTFGAISAYDGHQTNVGRVVVQSTWHHIININLVGTPTGSTPIKQAGFQATLAGQEVYKDIKSYFHNIGVWLSPKAKQQCMFRHAVWNSRWLYPLAEEVSSITAQEALKRASAGTIIAIGIAAQDALGRLASQCQITRWLIDFIIPPLRERIGIPIPDPWQIEFEQGQEPVTFIDQQLVLDAALGSVILAIAAEFPVRKLEEKSRIDQEFDRVLATSTTIAAQAIEQLLQQSCKDSLPIEVQEPIIR